MDVLEFKYLEGRSIAYAITKGSTGYHITVLDFSDLEDYCSCIGWYVRKRCRHVKWLVEKCMEECGMAIPIGKRIKEGVFRKFPSSLEALNEMFGGSAYSAGELFGIYAPAGTGKTLFAIQEAVWLTSKGYNVLYIETEGSGEEMIQKWAPIFAERFDGDLNRFYFESRRTLETLAQYLGFELKFATKKADESELTGSVNQLTLFDVDENGVKKKKGGRKKKSKKDEKVGKIEVMYRPLDISLIEQDIEKYKIDFIILDSLSMPIRATFPPDQQNNPSKSFVEARILQKFIELQEKFNVGVMVIMHASMNPARPYESAINFRGGLSVRHAVKRIVYLGKREKSGFDDYRKFWVVRASDTKPWSKVAVARITDLGYIDVPKEQWEEAFTSGEIKRIKQYLDIVNPENEEEENTEIEEVQGEENNEAIEEVNE